MRKSDIKQPHCHFLKSLFNLKPVESNVTHLSEYKNLFLFG